MTLPSRARMPLGILGAILLGGVIGLAWWSWRQRPGHERSARVRRIGAVLVATALVLMAVGAAWRLTVSSESVAGCSPPAGPRSSTRTAGPDAWVLTQDATTWPETGIGLLYARADDAHVCWSRNASYYVAVPASVFGARATNLGDVVLSPGYAHLTPEDRAEVAAHEERHRPQWTVAILIGGPLAFPIAYTVEDFFFPGSRNYFERQAGLEAGGYHDSAIGPVLGPAQLATLAVVAVIVVGLVVRAERRRASRRSASGDLAE